MTVKNHSDLRRTAPIIPITVTSAPTIGNHEMSSFKSFVGQNGFSDLITANIAMHWYPWYRQVVVAVDYNVLVAVLVELEPPLARSGGVV